MTVKKRSKMKVKEIIIEIKDTKEALKEFGDTLKALSRGKKVKPKTALSFGNVATMRRFLTDNRLQLLRLIKKEKPKSIYDLARIAKRDFKNVYEDLKILQGLGIVDLSKEKNNKKKLKPTLLYSGLSLHFAF